MRIKFILEAAINELRFSTADELSLLQRVFQQFTGLSKDFIIYGIGGSIGQVFGLVTVSVLTRVLPVAEYGVTDVIYAVIGYFSIIMSFNIGSGLFRFYYEVPNDALTERKQMVSSLFWFILLIGGSISITAAALGQFISLYLFKTQEYETAIQLAIIGLPLLALYNLFVGMQRLKRKPLNFILLHSLYALIYLGLVFLLVGIYKLGIEGIFIAQMSAYAICLLYGLWLERSLIVPAFSSTWFSRMAVYSLPLLPASFLHWSLVAINRYFLNAYNGPTQVGYYGLASKVSLIMALVVTAFIQSWQPIMLSNIKNPDSPRLYQLTLNYFFIGALMIAGVLTVFAREIFLLLAPPEYLIGIGLIGILVFRQILPGVDYITGAGIVISKRTIFTPISWGLGVVANLFVNLLFTPRYGIYGAAFAEMSGFLIGVLAITFFSYRLFPVKWDLKILSYSLLGFIAVNIITLGLIYTNLNLVLMLILKLGLSGAYILFLAQYIDPAQRKMLLAIPGEIYHRIHGRVLLNIRRSQ